MNTSAITTQLHVTHFGWGGHLGYAFQVLQRMFHSYKEDPEQLPAVMRNLKAQEPPPLSSTMQHPDKESAIKEFVSRYVSSELVH